MKLEGSLDAFSLPDIFSLLSMTKKTGGLHLRRADAHGVVWLGDGLITGGASDLSRESLGRRLAGSGQVADDGLAAAVEVVRADRSVGLAAVLRDAGAIDDAELHTQVCEHVVDTVFDLMRWPDGVFEFVVDEPNADDVGVRREVDEVVAEVRRRLEVWADIDPEVAEAGTVLSLARDLSGDLQLQPTEWELLSLLDGRRTVGEVVSICGRGEYGVVVALAELISRGLVRVGESEGVAARLRRLDLVAGLEHQSSVATPASDAEQRSGGADAGSAVVEPSMVMPEQPANDAESFDADVDFLVETAPVAVTESSDAADDELPREHIAEVSQLPRPSGPRDLSAVTPQRPEPFLPPRTPDHPEPLAAAMAGGGAVASAAPAIERDPSVNKSLLLRLIAGVRGL